MDTTHVNGHGRTEGALQAVQSKWCAPVPRLQMGGGAPFWERSDFSWVLSSRQPLMMWGVLLAPPVRPYNSQDKSPPNTEAMPAMVQRRPDHPSQTHRPEASGETRGGGGEGAAATAGRPCWSPWGPALVGGARPQSPACYTWPQSRF